MAYKRRYLSGQEAVTVDIGQGAVTADKILPGAVGPEALAPDAVTGEKILAGTIETSDLKDGLITPEKLAPNAVETEAIKDGAVTAAKIDPASGIPTRPLSPGLATAEIADEAVDHSKLKPECVESDSIKPGAVNTAAVAADAIDDTKIADDAVQAEHIENGAIVAGKCANNSISESCIINGSCTHDKLSDNAVYGDKVANLGIDPGKLDYNSVLEPNLSVNALSRRLWTSLVARENIFFEEFGGAGLSNKWVSAGEAGGGVVPDGANGIKILTGAVLHDKQQITFGGNGIVVPNVHGPAMMFLLTGRTEPKGLLRAWMGMWKDISNYIAFAVTDVGPGADNWKAVTRSGGVDTTEDTGIASIDGAMLFEIDVSDPASVKFYIDGILVKTITTNIPTAEVLEPWFYLDTGAAAAKYWLLKYVNIVGLNP